MSEPTERQADVAPDDGTGDGDQVGTELLLGNEAIARGAVEAGVGSVAAYPGTPSTEVGDTLRAEADDRGYHMEYAVNEKTALETGVAASYSGLRSLVVMKHVGLNVAADTFMSLAHSGVESGLVLVVADDPSLWSSQNEQDTRHYARFARVPVLVPTDPQEAKEMTTAAFELSEATGHPVIVRPTTRISHTRAPVTLGEVPPVERDGEFEPDPERFVQIPAHGRGLKAELLDRIEEVRAELETSTFNRVETVGEPDGVGVVASGIAYTYVREALEWLDAGADVLKLATPYPLPEDTVRSFLADHDRVLVVEELDPVVERMVRSLAQRTGVDVDVAGKQDDVMPTPFELTTGRVVEPLSSVLDVDPPAVTRDESDAGAEGTDREDLLVPRPPQFCPGCPHEQLYDGMAEVAGEDAINPGDIGCYTLGVNLGMVDVQFAMGAGTGFAAGFAQFNDEPVVATIGDSTFYHSGIPGLVNAVYNGADTTVVVLDNRTTAMTGQQPNPSTGWTAAGEDTTAVPIEDVAEAAGADFVATVDPYDGDDVRGTLEEAVETEGVSVVVSRAPCVLFRQEHGEQLDPIDARLGGDDA
jgi:indolepyruvate ferredoxin oxidoreductase alpha subunit